MNEDDEDEESPGASHHVWSNHQQQQILHQKNSKKGIGKQPAGVSMIAKVISSSNGTSSGSSTSKNGRYSS
jgi:hypothetical protein